MIAVVVKPASAFAIRMVLPKFDTAAGDDRAFCTPALFEIDNAMTDGSGRLLSSLFRRRGSLQQDGRIHLVRQTRFEVQERSRNEDAREHNEGETPGRVPRFVQRT